MRMRVKKLIQFLSYDIWRQNPETLSGKKNILYDTIKTVMLTVRNVQEQNIAAGARSLTYRTVLSIVPLLAILFAIARGFGIENIVESSIFSFMLNEETPLAQMEPATSAEEHADGSTYVVGPDSLQPFVKDQSRAKAGDVAEAVTASGRTRQMLNMLFGLIDNSLEEAKGGGLFAGIGILLFLYTVVLLFDDVEGSFNRIWQITQGRKLHRKVTDYFAFMLLMPIFFVLTNALNFISYPQSDVLKIVHILYPIVPRLLNVVPFVIVALMLTLLYKFIPNTRVKFLNALIAGLVAGAAFQFFQMMYLSGQLWITRYNAIYGTFAAIPLMLLWIQLSWFIVLIGAELSYAAQNVRKFSFEKETRTISRRYKDFFTLMIASVIVQHFADEKSPLTADQLSERCKAPARLANDILSELLAIRIISVTPSREDDRVQAYQPAVDINQITVNYLMTKLDEKGSEDFMIDMEGDFNEHWKALIGTRMCMYESKDDVLLKDL